MKGFQIWGRAVITSLEKFLSSHSNASREAIKVEEVERNEETIGVAEETKPIGREVKVVEEVERKMKQHPKRRSRWPESLSWLGQLRTKLR